MERIKFLFSNELLNEISVAGTKPKLKKYFSSNALQEMLLNMEDYIELVEVKSKINICRDIKDNFLLALAKDGRADFLLTGDKDLLTLQKYGKTEILSNSMFLEGMKQPK
ncbi:MAG: putative toxin-antitoxin system toxin component, PIN family [Chitinophagales bacterium]